jgi:hypothetical protein
MQRYVINQQKEEEKDKGRLDWKKTHTTSGNTRTYYDGGILFHHHACTLYIMRVLQLFLRF